MRPRGVHMRLLTGQNGCVMTEAELREMSPEDRRELARLLARIELPHPGIDPRQARRRRLALIAMAAICVILAVWIAILATTLHRHFVVRHWPVVWVGLDVAELAAFAVTAWAAWRQRQIVIVLMIITGTLLLCDAWFDLTLDYGSRAFTTSIISAAFAEIPLALILFAAARRLIRLTVSSGLRLQGFSGPMPPLWRVPLFSQGIEEALPSRLQRTAAPADSISSQ
jgi:hypothetical protein